MNTARLTNLLQAQITLDLLTRMVKLWSRTLRYTQVGFDSVQQARAQGPVIFALWHDELFSPCYLHRNQGIVAVVSASGDGEILAQVLNRLGFCLARGSSSRHGMQAIRQAMQTIQTRQVDAVLTVDGPKGPRHRVKEGAIYLAAKSGLPIVPVRVRMWPVKRFTKAWDKFQLPWPGARCKVLYGHPYSIVADKINSDLLQYERQRLETILHQMERQLQLSAFRSFPN